VPGTDYNFEYLVRNGSMIKSPTTEEFLPHIPGMFLYYWINKELKETTESAAWNAAKCLSIALATNMPLKKTLLHWERAMRYVRYSPTEAENCTENMSLVDLYSGCISKAMPNRIKRQILSVSLQPILMDWDDEDIFRLKQDSIYQSLSEMLILTIWKSIPFPQQSTSIYSIK